MLTVMLFALLMPTQQQAGQISYEYGSAAELKGVTKVYIYSGRDLDSRENIMKVLAKELPQLQVTDRLEDSQIELLYGGEAYEVAGPTISQGSGQVENDGSIRYGSVTTRRTRTVTSGEGMVIRTPQRSQEMRYHVIMATRGTKRNAFQRTPSTNFAREFVKAYKKATNLK